MKSAVIKSSVSVVPLRTQLQRIVGTNAIIFEIYKVEDCVFQLKSAARKDINKFPHLIMGDREVRLSDTAKVVIMDDFTCRSCGQQADNVAVYKHHEDSVHYGLIFYHMEQHKVCSHTKDHIIPKANGGPDEFNNYQNMCRICNLEKANDTEAVPPVKVSNDSALEMDDDNTNNYLHQHLRYTTKHIQIDTRNVSLLYKGDTVEYGNLILIDRTRYDMLLCTERVATRVVRDLSTFVADKLPWYLRLFKVDKLIDTYLEKYRKHVTSDAYKEFNKYVEHQVELDEREFNQ